MRALLPILLPALLSSVAGAVAEPPSWDRVELTARLGGCDPSADGCTHVRVAYPHFAAADPVSEGRLRAAVDELLLGPAVGEEPARSAQELVNGFLEAYRDASAEGFGAAMGWWLERDVEVVWAGVEALALKLVDDSYVGGAHPNRFDVWLVLDHEGDKLSLEDVFDPAALESLRTLGEAAFRAYHGVPPDDPLADHGFWFEEDRFTLNDNWGVRESGLVFHYNAYEVAAYALGATEIVLDWQHVAPLLAPGSPLADVAGGVR